MKNAPLSLLSTLALTMGLVGTVWTSDDALAKPTEDAAAKSAAELYAKNCASCHGKDGRAKTFKSKFFHARDLTDVAWQGNVTDERIFNSINNGKGKMPSFSKKLAEQEIESLVTYVRGLKK